MTSLLYRHENVQSGEYFYLNQCAMCDEFESIHKMTLLQSHCLLSSPQSVLRSSVSSCNSEGVSKEDRDSSCAREFGKNAFFFNANSHNGTNSQSSSRILSVLYTSLLFSSSSRTCRYESFCPRTSFAAVASQGGQTRASNIPKLPKSHLKFVKIAASMIRNYCDLNFPAPDSNHRVRNIPEQQQQNTFSPLPQGFRLREQRGPP